MLEHIFTKIIDHFQNYGLATVVTVIIAYLIGSVNFAIIVTRHYAKKDIRGFGSGNAGATNVIRTVGKRAGALTLAGDFLKGIAATGLGMLIFMLISGIDDGHSLEIKYGAYFAGFACIMGHILPVYFKFRGGKGVASAASIIIMLDYRVFLILISIFIIVVLITKIVSAGSVITAVLYPIVTFFVTYYLDYSSAENIAQNFAKFPDTYWQISLLLTFIMSLTVICKHFENIVRIIKGKENKLNIKFKKKA